MSYFFLGSVKPSHDLFTVDGMPLSYSSFETRTEQERMSEFQEELCHRFYLKPIFNSPKHYKINYSKYDGRADD